MPKRKKPEPKPEDQTPETIFNRDLVVSYKNTRIDYELTILPVANDKPFLRIMLEIKAPKLQ